jgi:hypothetical protein
MEKWKREFIRFLFPYAASRLRIETADTVKDPHIPSLLYKYRQFTDRHKAALAKGVEWMSSPDKFNDPYDSRIYFDTDRFIVEDQSVKELMETIKETKAAVRSGAHWMPKPINKPIELGELRRKVASELLASASIEERAALLNSTDFFDSYFKKLSEQLVHQMSQVFRRGYGVLCLAENSTSVLMWSHYSANHQGFCIEYNFEKLDPLDHRRRLCYPVFYRRKMTDATRYMSKINVRDFNNLFGLFICLLKSDEWAYEREWRIIHPVGSPLANREIEMPRPSAIILGALVNPADEAWMRKFCADNAISLKKVVQRHNEFRLEIRDFDARVGA